MSVKRYDLECPHWDEYNSSADDHMQQTLDGDYMLFSEHEQKLAEVGAELRAAWAEVARWQRLYNEDAIKPCNHRFEQVPAEGTAVTKACIFCGIGLSTNNGTKQ